MSTAKERRAEAEVQELLDRLIRDKMKEEDYANLTLSSVGQVFVLIAVVDAVCDWADAHDLLIEDQATEIAKRLVEMSATMTRARDLLDQFPDDAE